MPVETYAALAAVAVAACALHAAIGFGSGPLLVPVLLLTVDRSEAVVAAVLLGMATNGLQLAAEGRRPDVPVATLLPLWVAALPAAVVGAVLAGALTADTVAVLLAVTLAACAAAVIGRPRPLSRGASAIGGGVAGLAAAVTGVFGPLLGAFLVSAGLRGAELRDAIGLSFLVVGVFAVVATLALDPAWTGVALAGALLPAAVAGHALGRRAFGRVSATLHRRAVIVTVLIGASAALLPALG